MTHGDPGARHLSLAGFEEYLGHRVPMEYPIAGQPRLILFIDPWHPLVGLRMPHAGGEALPDIGLENIRLRATHGPDGRWLEVVVLDERLFLDAYPILCGIADRVQFDHLTLTAAVADTVRLLGRLLERTDTLPIERELGLVGELTLLRGLADACGPQEAVEAWRGADREEHDFGLRGTDIEVKTTSAERRTHWIGSLTQLDSTGGRPLWLVSHQLTQAGPDDGYTLTELVTAARKRVGRGPVLDTFERRLRAAGWSDLFANSTRRRWRHRAPSLALPVDSTFPRLTPAHLDDIDADLTRLVDVRYRVDLTGYPTTQPPAFLSAALATEVTT